MSFARRQPKTLPDRVQDMVWPRMGWGRALRYRLKRLLRVGGSPHAVAAGAAAGIFAAFSPFLGFHYIIAALLAFALGGSILAAAAVTTVANPLTLPLFWAASYEIGSLFMPSHVHFSAAAIIEQHTWAAIEPFLAPLVVGSVVAGAALGLVIYFPVRALVAGYQARRVRS